MSETIVSRPARAARPWVRGDFATKVLSYHMMIDDPIVLAIRRRAGLASLMEAEKALGATLETLLERLPLSLREQLLFALPPTVAERFSLPQVESNQPFSFDEFCQRLADREGTDVPVAVFHARCVLHVLSESLATADVLERVATHLTNDFAPLFWQATGTASAA